MAVWQMKLLALGGTVAVLANTGLSWSASLQEQDCRSQRTSVIGVIHTHQQSDATWLNEM